MTETVVSSATREVVIGFDRPFVIIGERINPTGRKMLALEMSAGDFSIFLTRPLCASLLAFAVVILAFAALHFGPKEIRDPNAD